MSQVDTATKHVRIIKKKILTLEWRNWQAPFQWPKYWDKCWDKSYGYLWMHWEGHITSVILQSKASNVYLIKGKHPSNTKWETFHKVIALYSSTMLVNIVQVNRKTEHQFQIKVYSRHLITKCSILSWEQTSEIPKRQICPKMIVSIF